MTHWNCTLMCINPEMLVDHSVYIESALMIEKPNLGPILTIGVKRISDDLPDSITFMRGYDPDGEWSEELKPGDLPLSIRNLFDNFKVKGAEELVQLERRRVNGIYFENHLVALSSFVCLDRFPAHSFGVWHWDAEKGHYTHSCTLLGCNFSESDPNVHPTGTSRIIDRNDQDIRRDTTCDHKWGLWRDLSDQSGVYIPPFLYENVCSICDVRWQAARLAKGI